jgi:hypothetical protein
MAPSRLGFRDTPSGARSDPLEVPPPAGGCGFSGVIRRVVIVELTLSVLGNEAKKADMSIGHDRSPPGSGIGIDTATAWGSECGTSPGLNRRKPTTLSTPASVWGGSPHFGQATRYAAAAGVKRSRQSGQHTWVIATLSHQLVCVPLVGRLSSPWVLSWQAVPAYWADPIHHRVVQALVVELEVDTGAPGRTRIGPTRTRCRCRSCIKLA